MKYAVIESIGSLVVNVIELDEVANWPIPEGHTIQQSETACIGDTWDGRQFIRPAIEQTLPQLDEGAF